MINTRSVFFVQMKRYREQTPLNITLPSASHSEYGPQALNTEYSMILMAELTDICPKRKSDCTTAAWTGHPRGEGLAIFWDLPGSWDIKIIMTLFVFPLPNWHNLVACWFAQTNYCGWYFKNAGIISKFLVWGSWPLSLGVLNFCRQPWLWLLGLRIIVQIVVSSVSW